MDEDRELAKRRLGSLVGGKWKLERVLGAGGVGAVYEAHDPTGEQVAIKILHPELAHKTDVKERFLREGTLANRVGHEGAVKILDCGTTDDGAGFLVMELLDGETLTELIRKDGPIGVNELFGYLDQVLDVLVAAHDADIIHRDLKPDNLFLTVTGQLKVLDFGLARRLSDIKGSFKTKTGLALGTLPYMAPEQALGRRSQVDSRVDLFALGALAFRVLTRRKIHEADSEAELLMKMASTPAPRVGDVAPHLPRSVQLVVDLALAFSKEARYPDARTMQLDVRDVLHGNPPRYASRHERERSNETRVEPWSAVAEPASRRVARTEPLEARVNTEPLPASTQVDGSAPYLIASAAAYPTRQAPIASAPNAPAVLPAGAAPLPAMIMAPPPRPGRRSPRTPLPWVLGTGTVLALLAAGAVAVSRLQPNTEPPPLPEPPPKSPATSTKPEPLQRSATLAADRTDPTDGDAPQHHPSARSAAIADPPRPEPEAPAPQVDSPPNNPQSEADAAASDATARRTRTTRSKTTSADEKARSASDRPTASRLERPRE